MNRSTVVEGLRIGLHGLKTRIVGPRRYTGTAENICHEIVEGCWDEGLGIFMTSRNNYPLFYARDFGMCIDSLLQLGHRERVRKSLSWALDHYRRGGRVTQIIRRNGRTFNFPDCESPDALAFLLHSIVALNDKALMREYRPFLEKELRRFCDAVVNAATGLCKRGLHLGGMRDYAVRDSSCYDNTMLAAIAKYAKMLKLKSPLQKYDYQKLLIENFWTGDHFRDDLANDEMTGDANVVPFWFKIFSEKKEKELFKKVLKRIQKEAFDTPYVLRYQTKKDIKTRMHWMEFFTNGWERDTVWLHLGNLLLQATARLDARAARRYLAGHRQLIEQEKHYPEVLDSDGKPHASWWYHADDSMLWAANFLALSEALEGAARKR